MQSQCMRSPNGYSQSRYFLWVSITPRGRPVNSFMSHCTLSAHILHIFSLSDSCRCALSLHSLPCTAEASCDVSCPSSAQTINIALATEHRLSSQPFTSIKFANRSSCNHSEPARRTEVHVGCHPIFVSDSCFYSKRLSMIKRMRPRLLVPQRETFKPLHGAP